MTAFKIAREPLVHFLLIGTLIFAAYSLFNGNSWSANTIVVSSPKIAQMTEIFAKTWQRPPNPDEVKAMIDDYVKEELYVRQALALGLDQDDTIIRRRLRQKMEFLGDAEAESIIPSDAELQSYLDAHARDYEVASEFSLQQIFLNPDRHRGRMDQDAADLLRRLQSDANADLTDLGDPTMLPADLPLTPLNAIREIYGVDVSDAVRRAEAGRWTGPVRSDFGVHLIRIAGHRAGRIPPLSEIRKAVHEDWMQAKRREIEERKLAGMLKHYRVVIDSPASGGGSTP